MSSGRAIGDTTTLADPAVVAKLKDMYESRESLRAVRGET